MDAAFVKAEEIRRADLAEAERETAEAAKQTAQLFETLQEAAATRAVAVDAAFQANDEKLVGIVERTAASFADVSRTAEALAGRVTNVETVAVLADETNALQEEKMAVMVAERDALFENAEAKRAEAAEELQTALDARFASLDDARLAKEAAEDAVRTQRDADVAAKFEAMDADRLSKEVAAAESSNAREARLETRFAALSDERLAAEASVSERFEQLDRDRADKDEAAAVEHERRRLAVDEQVEALRLQSAEAASRIGAAVDQKLEAVDARASEQADAIQTKFDAVGAAFSQQQDDFAEAEAARLSVVDDKFDAVDRPERYEPRRSSRGQDSRAAAKMISATRLRGLSHVSAASRPRLLVSADSLTS